MLEILTQDHPLDVDLPIVATAGYLQSKASKYGWFRGNGLLLPFLVERRAMFQRLVFTHQTISLQEPDIPPAVEVDFLNQVVASARGMGVDFIYQPQATAVFSAVPHGAVYAPFGSYVVDLRLPQEQLWSNLHGKHRNVIRRAMDAGVEITEDPENLRPCFDLIDATMTRNKKLSVGLDELRRFREKLGANASFFLAHAGGQVHGAAFIVWNSGHTAYYLHGGSVEDAVGGGMNLLHWQAMCAMKARGVTHYDFVGARLQPPQGSKLESMQRFKSRFGATLKRGYLWKIPLRPMRYAAFQLFARANAMLHGATYSGDIIDEERANG